MNPNDKNPAPDQTPAGLPAISNPTYAQIVTLSMNQYDATLIFSQVQPVTLKPGDTNVTMVGKEVARITMPLQTVNELKEMFINLQPSKADAKKSQ